MPLGSVVCLLGTAVLVGIGPLPAGAAPATLFSSTTPGVVASPPVVPAGVCSVTITAEGGRGGAAGVPQVAGGAAASVTARVLVSPGDALHVLVGGAGGNQSEDGNASGDGGAGGGGGGGKGGGGGGGASAIWTAAQVPLVVAGAGGGAGGPHRWRRGLLGQRGDGINRNP